jgi:hypothetical protein
LDEVGLVHEGDIADGAVAFEGDDDAAKAMPSIMRPATFPQERTSKVNRRSGMERPTVTVVTRSKAWKAAWPRRRVLPSAIPRA